MPVVRTLRFRRLMAPQGVLVPVHFLDVARWGIKKAIS